MEQIATYLTIISLRRRKGTKIILLYTRVTRTVYKPEVCKNIFRESIEKELETFYKNLQTTTEIFQFVLRLVF